MTDEASLSAERSERPTQSDDRRDAERHPCNLQPIWRIEGTNQIDANTAAIRDISATGIGFRIQQSIKSGTVLILTLQSHDQRFRRPLPARVMHVTPQAEGDWLVGCRFVRALSAQELRILLGED
jgi:PilZ domain